MYIDATGCRQCRACNSITHEQLRSRLVVVFFLSFLESFLSIAKPMAMSLPVFMDVLFPFVQFSAVAPSARRSNALVSLSFEFLPERK